MRLGSGRNGVEEAEDWSGQVEPATSQTGHRFSPSRHVRTLRRQSILSLCGASTGAVAGLALVLFAARSLEADEAGSAFLAIAVFSVVARVAQLGTGTALVHFMTREHARIADRGLPVLLRMALPRVAIASVLLAAGLYFSAETLSGFVQTNESRDALTRSLQLGALFVPTTALMTVLLDATRGFAQVRPTVIVDRIGRPVGQLLAIAFVVVSSGGASALTLAWTAPSAFGLIAAAWWLRRLYRASYSGPEPSPTTTVNAVTARQFWACSWPQGGVDAIRTLVRWQDGIVIGILLGAGPAAIYVAVTRLVKVASLANQALSETVAPHVGEALAVDDKERSTVLYHAATTWLILLLGPIYLATGLYAETFTAIFGVGYADAAVVLVILSVGKLAGTVVGPVEAILIVSGRTGINLGNHVVSLLANVSLNLLLVPWLGLRGAAISWVVSILITNYGPYLQLRASTGLTPFDRTTAAVAAGVFAALSLPAAVLEFGVGQTPLSVAAALTLSVIMLVVGTYRYRVPLQLDVVAGSSHPHPTDLATREHDDKRVVTV